MTSAILKIKSAYADLPIALTLKSPAVRLRLPLRTEAYKKADMIHTQDSMSLPQKISFGKINRILRPPPAYVL